MTERLPESERRAGLDKVERRRDAFRVGQGPEAGRTGPLGGRERVAHWEVFTGLNAACCIWASLVLGEKDSRR